MTTEDLTNYGNDNLNIDRFFLSNNSSSESCNAIRISISSPDSIRSASFGEIKKPETVNYRSFKPERDGLFCCRIFGPVKDYECLCGKYRTVRYKGVVCEKCGVEVTTSVVRRRRMAHIELATPCVNPLFYNTICQLLSIPLNKLVRIIYHELYIVIDPKDTTMQKNQVLTEDEINSIIDNDTDGVSFEFGRGSKAIQSCLLKLDIDYEIEKTTLLRSKTKSEAKINSLQKKLLILKSFKSSGNKFSWMVFEAFPVLPPDLRPLVALDGGRFASSDMNDLYRKIINRNNRLKRIISSASAPISIIENESNMLQSAIHYCIIGSNGSQSAFKDGSTREFKSILERIKGKNGIMRGSLLGKRVDYSGRTVIIVGPKLKLNQCGLPKDMALELFRPHIINFLTRFGIASDVKECLKLISNRDPEVFYALEHILEDKVVLLNRAPTLHRLGIQAFKIVLTEYKAIMLHPLVCKAFNADFDGDQMAVHVPLTIEAQIEASVLMMSTRNILSPANGDPVIVPSTDMTLGFFYNTRRLSLIDETDESKLLSFGSLDEIDIAIYHKRITLGSLIRYRDSVSGKIFVTTPANVMIRHAAPIQDADFSIFNEVITSKTIGKLIKDVQYNYGNEAVAEFSDNMTRLGFKWSTQSGISFGIDDMIVPKEKDRYVNESMDYVKDLNNQIRDGFITENERKNKMIDCWSECVNKVSNDLMLELKKDMFNDNANPICMMVYSGARGKEAQVKQLSGMRGLITTSSGDVVDFPVVSNFKLGLRSDEMFVCTSGTRKGLTDTALKTADAGYLTRRLVDVAMDCVISCGDCGTSKFVEYYLSDDLNNSVVFGRVLADNVLFSDGSVAIEKGSLIDETNFSIFKSLSLHSVKLRSVTSCEAIGGICSKCYGRNLSTGKLVEIGEAVGVIAAQSIGEPGAQLTMNTFHIGGIASHKSQESVLKASCDGSILIDKNDLKFVVPFDGSYVTIKNNIKISMINSSGKAIWSKLLPNRSIINKTNESNVLQGDLVASWDPYNNYFVSRENGTIRFNDIINGTSCRDYFDSLTGRTTTTITDWPINKKISPSISVLNSFGEEIDRHLLFSGSVIIVKEGDSVLPGSVLAKMSKLSSSLSTDITGGLPRVEDIFEARKPKDVEVVSDIDGVVEVDEGKFGGKVKIRVTSTSQFNDKGEPVVCSYSVSRKKYIKVSTGDFVPSGAVIVDGEKNMYDILKIDGPDKLSDYICKEVSLVYSSQGVSISRKHIEIIVRSMLQSCEITNSGDSSFEVGQKTVVSNVTVVNNLLKKEGKQPCEYSVNLQGITKASLHTKSFIASAAFQETSKVLVNAAIAGRVDRLSGVTESVILANKLAPIGTGLVERELCHYSAVITNQAQENQNIDSNVEIAIDDFVFDD